MCTTQQMLDAFPADRGGIDRLSLAGCIDACLDCAQTCTACADACLNEQMVDQLRSCIGTDLNCADICATTARVLSWHTGYDPNLTRILLQACVAACRTCGAECARHADVHDHCRICAETCRACEQACTDLLDSIG